MKEYIERAAALDVVKRTSGDYVAAWSEIAHIPAADVAEVRHGRWEFLGPNRLIKSCMCGTCSVCHVRSVYIVNTAICPNCGAPMDKEDEHEAN
jgi:hypothetical protein